MANAKDVVIKIRTDNGQLDKGLKDAEMKLGSFGNDILKKMTGYLAGAFAVERIASFTMELAKLSGETEGVRAAFERIANNDTMKDLQKATHGTVTELELMKRAVSADNLGIPVKNLANLFQFATKRAQDTGQSVDYLVDSIVLGIGRKSPLILDNLGISAVQLKDKLHGVGLETASVGDIAQAVGEIAADSMTKSGDVIDTNAIKIQGLKAQWEDFKMSLAENPDFNQATGNFLDWIGRQLKLLPGDLDRFQKSWNFVFGSWIKTPSELFDPDQEIAEKNKKFYQQIAQYMQLGTKPVKEYEKTVGELKAETDALAASVDNLGISQTAEGQRIMKQVTANRELIKAFTELKILREDNRLLSRELMKTRTDLPQIDQSQLNGGPSILMPEFDKIQQAGAGYMDKYKQLMAEQQAEVDELNARFSGALAESLAGGIEAAFSGKGLESTLIAFLNPLSNFLTTEGSMLIAHGIAVEAFKKSLTSLNGIPAIVAGAAMVATGAAFKGFVKGGLNSSGAGYATGQGGYGGAGGFGSSTGKQSVDISGQFEVKGNDLVYILAKQYNNNNRTRT